MSPLLLIKNMSVNLTTRLEAINTMLTTIGEAPINSLSEQTVDAAIAGNILDEINRDVQSTGWHFNTSRQVELVPNSEDKITLASNIIQIRIDERVYSSIRPVIRGSYLYDVKNNTYEFDSSIKADIVYLLDLLDLPEAARRYITLKAARTFQARLLSNAQITKQIEEDVVRALALLKREEARTAKHNMGYDNSLGLYILTRNL